MIDKNTILVDDDGNPIPTTGFKKRKSKRTLYRNKKKLKNAKRS